MTRRVRRKAMGAGLGLRSSQADVGDPRVGLQIGEVQHDVVARIVAPMAERGWSGLYLRQQGKDYSFVRFYEDGEVLFASVSSSSPRKDVIESVRAWFHREGKARDRATYRVDEDGISFDHATPTKSLSVRGERDALGRVALLWRESKTGIETLRVYSPLGQPGDLLPVYLNVADVHELSELPGIAKGLADRIVQHREQHGPFQTVDALLEIKGFTSAKLAACRARCDASPAVPLGLAAAPPPPLVITRELLAGVLKEALGPRVDPKAPTLRKLGRFDVVLEVVMSHPTPLTVVSYGRGGDGFELRGRHTDDAVIEAALEAVDRLSKPDIAALDCVRVLPMMTKQFDCVVLVPGHLEKLHEPPLQDVMHRYYPARSFEVQDGMSIHVFTRLMSSTVGLKLIDWQRSPQPLLRIQVRNPLPKCGYGVMKVPQLEKPSHVGSMFANHLKSEVVEIWDSSDRHAVLEGRQRAIHARYTDTSGEPVEVEILHASFPAALDRFLKGGALA